MSCPRARANRNFIYVPAYNIIFAYVPKVACTNWKCLMRRLSGFEDWLDTTKAHDKKASGLFRFDPKDGNHELFHRPGVKVFTMVRDPRTRAMSAYLNKIHPSVAELQKSGGQGATRSTLEIEKFRKKCLSKSAHPEISFEVFLLWLRDSMNRRTFNEHWLPQVKLLRHGGVSFDLVGRFENIAEDSRRILDAIGTDIAFPTQSELKFPPTGAQSKFAKHSTPECEELLQEIYRADIEAYGY